MKRAAAILFGVAAMVLLASCGGGAKTKDAGSGAAAPSGPAGAATSGQVASNDAGKPAGKEVSANDGQQVFKQMVEAQQAAKSWRSVTAIVLDKAKNQTLETRTEVVCPDRQHTISSGFIAGQQNETIRIGNDTWTKTGNTWTKGTTAPVRTPVCLDEKSRQEAQKQAQELLGKDATSDVLTSFEQLAKRATFTKGGVSEMDGAKVQQWSVVIPGEKAGDDTLSYSIWIAVNDHLPRRTEFKDGSVTTTYSDWNKKIVIDAPN